MVMTAERIDASIARTATRQTLLFVTTLDLGRKTGPAEHVAGIVRNLAADGFDVTVLSPTPSDAIERHPFGRASLEHFASARRLGLPNACSSLLGLVCLLRHRRHDILYVRSSAGTLALAALGRLTGFKRIVVEHNGWLGDEVITFRKGTGNARLARIAAWSQVREARLATTNRAVTPELRDMLVRNGIAAERIDVIGNGTDTGHFRPLDRDTCRRELGLPLDDTRVVAFIGNLWPGAGVEPLLDAVEMLARRGTPMRLVIGGDGISRAALTADVERRFGARGPVSFAGWLGPEQANVLLGAADVAAAPYLAARTDSAGNSALKIRMYAAAGKPVVVSRLKGTADLAREPWAFLAEPGEPTSIADAIARALAADAGKMAASARTFGESNDWSVVAGRIGKMLRRPFPA